MDSFSYLDNDYTIHTQSSSSWVNSQTMDQTRGMYNSSQESMADLNQAFVTYTSGQDYCGDNFQLQTNVQNLQGYTPLDRGGYEVYGSGEDLSGSDLPQLSFFNEGKYASHSYWYTSPTGSAFTDSPPSTTRSNESLLSPPQSPYVSVDEATSPASYLSPFSMPLSYESPTSSYPQPPIFDDYQHLPPQQWVPKQPSPNTTGAVSPAISNWQQVPDNSMLFGDIQPELFPKKLESPTREIASPRYEVPQQRKTARKNRNAKKPYLPGRPSSADLPYGKVPHPVNSLDTGHSFTEGMYLFRWENKARVVDGFCYYPLELAQSVETFCHAFLYQPKPKDSNPQKESNGQNIPNPQYDLNNYLPSYYTMSGGCQSGKEGNRDRGKKSRKDPSKPGVCSCKLCGSDYTSLTNGIYHVLGHFNVKPMAAACGMLFVNSTDVKRHWKCCKDCTAVQEIPQVYHVPFDELRCSLLEGARWNPINHSWNIPERSIQRYEGLQKLES